MLGYGRLFLVLALTAALCACDESSESPTPSITLLSPAGGEKWTVGSVQKIEWQANAVDAGDLLFEISWDGGITWDVLILPASEPGSAEWTVDTSGRPLLQRHCIVRVSKWDDPAISDRSGELTVWSGTVWYADDDAPDGGDGTSWQTAFRRPQDAVDAASAGDAVWVAAGTYSDGDPWSVLILQKGLAVYGGFAGSEKDPSERDLEANETVLDGNDFWSPVVECTSNAVVDGFTIIGGWMESSDAGAGLRAEDADLLVANCVFRGNNSSGGGGGAYFLRSQVEVLDCVFEANSATSSGGGAVANQSTAAFRRCRFDGNEVRRGDGGGMAVYGWSYVTISRCVFVRNSAGYGGALSEGSCGSMDVSNCIVAGNVAERGAALDYEAVEWKPTIRNCTIAGNVATDGATNAVSDLYPTTISVSGCVVWDNPVPSGQAVADAQVTITYSCVDGGWPGEGNIDADPRFVTRGYWDDNGTPADRSDDSWIDGDYHLSSSSPCIDAGDPGSTITEDIEGNPRPVGWGFDMGAYEFQDPLVGLASGQGCTASTTISVVPLLCIFLGAVGCRAGRR